MTGMCHRPHRDRGWILFKRTSFLRYLWASWLVEGKHSTAEGRACFMPARFDCDTILSVELLRAGDSRCIFITFWFLFSASRNSRGGGER